MGAFHWLESQTTTATSTITTTTTATTATNKQKVASSISYEWAMKKLPSSKFLPNLQIPDSNLEQEEEGRRSEINQEEPARCEWDFHLSTVISSNNREISSNGSVSDTIGVIEFDPNDNFLATGGIARKIRVYSVRKLVRESGNTIALDNSTACDYYICTPAKLSSLKWKPGSSGRVIGSGDYDGVVMEYDLERRIPVFERDEHGGRRVLSMDYSSKDPVLGASGSEDGTMQVWDPRCHGSGCGDGGQCVARVQPNRTGPSPVCCVEFNPFGGSDFLAVGCADRRVYGYDLRRLVDPVMVLDGHQKAVTYVKFLNQCTVVTSSTDGCLKMWSTEDQSPVRTYKGHVNSRRFVGLSVWSNGGLLSCGSENNQVFVYDTRWGDPIWVHGFNSASSDPPEFNRSFVSSVCWRQTEDGLCTLVAGGSDGALQVFQGRKKKHLVIGN